jgi:hypothetical protein
VTVIVTVLPASAGAGVYVNEKGDDPAEAGVTEPAPFSVMVTEVAFVNVLPLTVTGLVPHVLSLRLLNESAGPLTQPHDTAKLDPGVIQPAAFLTVII